MSRIPPHLEAEVDKWRNFPRERPAAHEIVPPLPGQESVWDYPRPPRVEPTSKRVEVWMGQTVIASTTAAFRVLETAGPPVYYIPPNDIVWPFLQETDHSTLCEWKGESTYWSIVFEGQTIDHAAWGYRRPWEGFDQIQDYVAFNASLVDRCYVNSELVTPQPGSYYGGWITADIVGPFKGEPGSKRW